MPTYLDFNTTKNFRDALIVRTLQQPNGPQTFNANNYTVQNLSDFANVDPGAVDTNRANDLLQIQTRNIFKPLEFFIKDTIDTIPRRANLQLYYNGTPYFRSGDYNLISIMTTANYDNESELFKFAASYIRDKDQKGPVYSRIEQNLKRVTEGRVRLLDAIQGNNTTAINLLTGREPLVDPNYQITVAKTLPGKAIDFLQSVAGVEFPFTEIPGDYLTNPANPVNFRPEARTEVGAILQDVTGALGSLIGIQRRPQRDRKPSDLFIEYMGQGQKQRLFDNLSFSKYAPNYTTTARSQNSSKLFNFVDNVAQGVKNVLGVEAPAGIAYIGDDRSNDVKYAMSDFNDRPVKSSFYLSLLFDEVQAILFQRTKNIGEGGQISNKLTWISKNSRNEIGANNQYFEIQKSNFDQSLSNNFEFREDSILGVTQELLNTLPTNGGEARSHVANVIDQTSRVFREGDIRISRGSAVKYTNKFSGEESGVEYCRVWTKDRPYMTRSDTMKRGTNIRKFEGSVLTTPYNLNIAPMSNGNKSFEGSSNIMKMGDGFFAKKYMFSIENLAWKTSNRNGFTVQDLPYCERGPNGGRVMWFPPYDLKVSEQNSARWEENTFLGRPEPIYTYQNTARSGQISFKVVVDHPSIMNLLVREFFKNMSDEESDNYINAFFAGCQDVDLYDLVKKYTTLNQSDIELIQQYLNAGVSTEIIQKYKVVTEQVKPDEPKPPVSPDGGGVQPQNVNLDVNLKFENDYPKPSTKNFITGESYETAYAYYKGGSPTQPTGDYDKQKQALQNDLEILLTAYSGTPNPGPKMKNDIKLLYGKEDVKGTPKNDLIQISLNRLTDIFNKLDENYQKYKTTLDQLKIDISGGTVDQVVIEIASSTSALTNSEYNLNLSLRRTYSILTQIFEKISNNPSFDIESFRKEKLKWEFPVQSNGNVKDTGGSPIEWRNEILTFKDIGYELEGKLIVKTINYGEYGKVEENGSSVSCTNQDFLYPLNVPRNEILDVVSPVAVNCRQSKVKISYVKKEKQSDPVKPPPVDLTPPILPKTSLEEDEKIEIKKEIKKPPIDVMKRLIMKTLSECFYFKKLEEDSPIQFSSLKEKLRYFHPAFHSMTPEGLNSRLTFLHQCIRPGDTLPIKGISDEADLNARNTTFGPPPICIIRIGDFYNSKVVIKDISINFDDGVWDFNPEGIGVQPMIASVTLQVSFIGGHGLERPVEKLQNALSSNFYANTEMYDERSIPTNTKIAGVDVEQFTKQFLEEIQNNPKEPVKPKDEVKNANNVANGKFIGKIEGNQISYDDLVNDLYTQVENYFEKYKSAYNTSVLKYGEDLTSLFFSPNYRTINKFDVFKTPNGTQTDVLDLIGEYPKSKELPIILRDVREKFVEVIENKIPSLTKDMLDANISDTKVPNSDLILKPFISSEIKKIFDEMPEKFGAIEKDLILARNQIIKTLDGLNYLIYYIHDGKIENEKYTKADLSGFTFNILLDKYDNAYEYILDNHVRLTNKISNTINFNNLPSITDNQVIKMISNLLSDRKNDILGLYTDVIVFRPDVEKRKLGRALDKFLEKPDEVKFKLKKYPKRKDNNKIKFEISNQSDITDNNEKDTLKKINSTKLPVDKKLNYFRNE
jgi:hypothetical protein